MDETECSVELRAFLSEVEAEELERYVTECLAPTAGRSRQKIRRRFDDSGFVLQDVVNEIGRRLDFAVTNGVYQGRPHLTGFDGIWRDGSGTDLVIEVKTTDTYSISLDTVDRYRRDLIEKGVIADGSAVLFIVGRDDTGALEAQIRGSQHAWTMRMIGAASLIRLLHVKVNAESPFVVDRIRSIVRPIEYTRVDRIVDLMFEVRADTDDPAPEPESSDIIQSSDIQGTSPRSHRASAPTAGIESLRQAAADVVSEYLIVRLTRRRRSSFETANDAVRAVVSVSKRYNRDYQSYWYAFYDTQRAYLTDATSGYLVLCAADTGRVWTVPVSVIEPLVRSMNSTTRADGQIYWHVLTKLAGHDCVLVAGDQELTLTPYEASR
ncbi:hypothetical protein NKH95_01855 [Mesorhizobium sp. M0848]|uniref:hypothetical protein n=1 Tax=Mesorhizobium sp. M0848 TaxID=2957012 RepID=UPI003336BFF4